MQYQSKRHSVFQLHVHLVFVTKYRRKIFKQHHLYSLNTIFSDVSKNLSSTLIQFDGTSDHMHLLLSYNPVISLSQLANRLKGVSSRLIRQRYQEIRFSFKKNCLWSPSYFASSCGGAPIEILKRYIRNQSK